MRLRTANNRRRAKERRPRLFRLPAVPWQVRLTKKLFDDIKAMNVAGPAEWNRRYMSHFGMDIGSTPSVGYVALFDPATGQMAYPPVSANQFYLGDDPDLHAVDAMRYAMEALKKRTFRRMMDLLEEAGLVEPPPEPAVDRHGGSPEGHANREAP